MPATLATTLATCGHDTDTVPEENLAGKPDPDVWRATQQAKRFLITQDLDFSDIRQFRPGNHHGLLLVRLINPSRQNLIEQVTLAFKMEKVETWRHCFVVLTERKIRVRRP